MSRTYVHFGNPFRLPAEIGPDVAHALRGNDDTTICIIIAELFKQREKFPRGIIAIVNETVNRDRDFSHRYL